MLTPFLTTYLYKTVFPLMTTIRNKLINWLDVSPTTRMRLIKSVELRIDKIISN